MENDWVPIFGNLLIYGVCIGLFVALIEYGSNHHDDDDAYSKFAAYGAFILAGVISLFVLALFFAWVAKGTCDSAGGTC